jgi:hypothetical protein
VRKIARGRENRDFKIAFQLAKSAKFLHRRNGTLLSPHEQGRLAQTTKRVADIDVEMPGQECRGRVTGASLVRSGIIDVDQLAAYE